MSGDVITGTQVLNEWISRMEQKIDKPICRIFGAGNPSPYLVWSDSTHDGSLSFVIDGHKIKAQHVWLDNPDFSEPIILDSIVEGENVFVGYKSDLGMCLMLQTDSLEYMEEHGEERPHPMELFLERVCKEFFESWAPGQMDIQILAIFSRMRNNNIGRMRDDVTRHRQLVTEQNARTQQHMTNLAAAQRKVIAAERLDPVEFRRECAGWEDLLMHQGGLNIDSANNLCLRMPVFTINDESDWNDGNGIDVELGPLLVKFNMGDYSMSVGSEGNLSHGDRYPHPHVSNDGRICWGNSTQIIERLLENPNPMEILFTTANFLKTGYHEPGAYQSLRNWLPPSGWMCDHCHVRHQDGARCPHQCAHCEAYVDFSQHAHCEEHDCCYTRPGMCQGCLERLPRIGAFAPGTEDMPAVIQAPRYVNPQNEQERSSTYEFVGFGRECLIEHEFIKEESWYWIQSSSSDDDLLRKMDYIYQRHENGSYGLFWNNPDPAEISDPPEEPEDDEETTGDSPPVEAEQETLLRNYFEEGMSAQQLVDSLHTDRIPSYDDVAEGNRTALRAFRRRATAQRLRLCERFIANQEVLENTGS